MELSTLIEILATIAFVLVMRSKISSIGDDGATYVARTSTIAKWNKQLQKASSTTPTSNPGEIFKDCRLLSPVSFKRDWEIAIGKDGRPRIARKVSIEIHSPKVSVTKYRIAVRFHENVPKELIPSLTPYIQRELSDSGLISSELTLEGFHEEKGWIYSFK